MINVIIFDNCPLLLKAFNDIAKELPDIDIVAEALNISELFNHVNNTHCDIVILNI